MRTRITPAELHVLPPSLALPLLMALAFACGNSGEEATRASTSAPGGAPYTNRSPRSGEGGTTQATTKPDPGTSAPETTEPETAAPVVPVDTGETGSISGVAFWSGSVPMMPLIDAIATTTGCQHGDTPRKQTIVVEDGKLANAFVYISGKYDEAKVPPPSREPLVINQLGCMFDPHVIGVQVGRTVEAKNSDPLSHNVRVSAKRNDGDNQTIGPGSPPLSIEFERAEVPVLFACDLHPWMSAFVCVTETPWYAVTAPDGTFTIENVPAGTYEVSIWHESSRVKRPKKLRSVVVSSNQDTKLELAFEKK